MPNPALGVSGLAPLNNPVHLESRYLTRHGLIAGSTGTGKSRAMQLLAEQLADAGVNVFVSDVKGDASGFCVEGEESGRNELAPFRPHPIKANYWSASDALCRMRFSLRDSGPVLLARLLELNPTQESHLALAFAYARKNGAELDTLEDLLDILEAIVKAGERGIAKSSVSVIERKLLSLRESGLGDLFGAPSVSLDDLRGLNVLNLSDSRQNMLVSIAPAFILQRLFSEMPEVGDVDEPKFAIFFDEAHYLFRGANRSLRDLITTILRQIRSKGVSVFFVTQDAGDLPDDVLGQLGTKIVFAQRVGSARGESDLRALARCFPKATDMDVAEELKSLPPGVAIMTTLDSDGNQAKPVKVTLFSPATTMGVVPVEKLREETDPELLERYAAPQAAPKPKTTGAKPAQQAKKTETPAPAAQTQKTENPAPEKAKPAPSGQSIWDAVFRFLLKLLDFLLKAAGKVLNAALVKPVQGLFKWIFRKPARIAYVLLFLLLLYVLYVNWALVQGFLDRLKLG